jgi:hypothetical protein
MYSEKMFFIQSFLFKVTLSFQNVIFVHFQGQNPDRSAILVESQAVQESLEVSDNNIYLIYHSARTKGYLSTIQLQLTPDSVPASLVKVHLKITIEGVVHEKVFEADPNIRYTYSWDRLNEYRQVNT